MLMICLSLVDTPEEKSKFRQLYEKYRGLMFTAPEKSSGMTGWRRRQSRRRL